APCIRHTPTALADDLLPRKEQATVTSRRSTVAGEDVQAKWNLARPPATAALAEDETLRGGENARRSANAVQRGPESPSRESVTALPGLPTSPQLRRQCHRCGL